MIIIENITDALIKHDNIKGIKTADWELIQAIARKYPEKDFIFTGYCYGCGRL